MLACFLSYLFVLSCGHFSAASISNGGFLIGCCLARNTKFLYESREKTSPQSVFEYHPLNSFFSLILRRDSDHLTHDILQRKFMSENHFYLFLFRASELRSDARKKASHVWNEIIPDNRTRKLSSFSSKYIQTSSNSHCM